VHGKSTLRDGLHRGRGTSHRSVKRRNAWAYLMVTPYLVCVILFFVVPFVLAVPVSLTNWSIIGRPSFVGLNNYIRLFKDSSVLQALWNTVRYVLLQVPSLMVIGLGLALLLNMQLKGRTLARVIVVMPYVVNVVVMGIIWRWMFDPNFGIINYYLRRLGLEGSWWLTDTRTAMLSIVIANWWWSAGFNTVVYLAGLQGIPRELYEAAAVDGATGWVAFRHVTLPSLRPVTFYILLMDTITSFQLFGEPFVMTQGGPLGSTTTLTYKIYNSAFVELKLGYASAISVLFLAVIGVLVLLQSRVVKSGID
jgi:multiple sugar transport system permease protein